MSKEQVFTRWIDPSIEELKRQIEIKDKFCGLITALGFDYDGFNTADELKGLIDTIVDYANKAIQCDDKSPIYVNGDDKPLNILLEKVKVEQ